MLAQLYPQPVVAAVQRSGNAGLLPLQLMHDYIFLPRLLFRQTCRYRYPVFLYLLSMCSCLCCRLQLSGLLIHHPDIV